MRTTLLSMFMIAGLTMAAQTTHNLDWFIGISASEASITIDEGDTVIWTLTDTAPHTVTSDGGSTETFDSGTLSAGSTFSYTFTVAGVNPYHCNFHSGMTGVITVEDLGVEEKSIRNFSMSPNPASTEISIGLPTRIENARVVVFNLLGERIYKVPFDALNTTINVSAWSDGVYLVKVTNGSLSQTKRFIKN